MDRLKQIESFVAVATKGSLTAAAQADGLAPAVVGRRIEEIPLPPGAQIGAIVRGAAPEAEVLMPHHDTVVQTDDHVLIFIPNKRLVREVEKLFQVGATFFG